MCCNVLQCVADSCIVLQCAAMCCSVLQRVAVLNYVRLLHISTHKKHAATFCNTLQHFAATHCNTQYRILWKYPAASQQSRTELEILKSQLRVTLFGIFRDDFTFQNFWSINVSQFSKISDPSTSQQRQNIQILESKIAMGWLRLVGSIKL